MDSKRKVNSMYTVKKLLLVVILLALMGCETSQGYKSFSISKEHYTRIMSSYSCSKLPEFYGLKEKISKQEYRLLPLHLQNCYEPF